MNMKLVHKIEDSYLIKKNKNKKIWPKIQFIQIKAKIIYKLIRINLKSMKKITHILHNLKFRNFKIMIRFNKTEIKSKILILNLPKN